MIAADTSVVVAAFASWHEAHDAARNALRRKVRLPAQVFIETYSVLTRLPPPHRVAASVVESYLVEQFPEAPLTLPGHAHRALLGAAVANGLPGGAICDALIAATAGHAGAVLLTRDRRAASIYERLGVRFEMVV